MNVLVTGASGFIGRCLVEKLLAGKHRVRALVRETSRVAPLQELGAELCYGDLRDPSSLPQAVRGADVVFHAAARVGVWGQPQEYHEVNVLGTRQVLEALVRAGVPRLVYFSSIAVYGRNTGLISETRPPQRTGDAHGDSKIEAEELVLASSRAQRFTWTILRPSLVYGRYDYKYIPRVAHNILKGRMRVVGPGTNFVPLIYGDDVADFAVRAAESEAAAGEIFNVSSGEPVTWKEFLTALAMHLGMRLPRAHLPFLLVYAAAAVLEPVWKLAGARNPPPVTKFGTRLLSSDWRYDITKAERLLGFRPRVFYREGLARTLAWMREERLVP
jgi:nucleoside-diphosphate-sugar epimerase